MTTLREKCGPHWSAIKAIGLSGQMHGAVLLDERGEVIRPAILWNDTRCADECRELEEAAPELHQVAGNLAMPGFTAPKAAVGAPPRAGQLPAHGDGDAAEGLSPLTE
ncbi:Xylulose kinase [Raoultella terrigena]|uniref:Xylulose kinase n=1 Tax=Raoultella terrigena TaxID=577 RepID=A0A3P8M183_RAOTE|nr:Xylulose kinase [Raoultella terrigena]